MGQAAQKAPTALYSAHGIKTATQETPMADEHISEASPAGVEIDSLTANEFAVEVDGERATGIFRVSGLIPFKIEIKPTLSKVVREPVKIAKMVERDPQNRFNQWVQESYRSREDIVRPTRQLSIIALDEGSETRRWNIEGAYLIEISYSDFNSGSSELVEEVLTIMYEHIDEAWPNP
jgi:hypothetical protein